MVLIISLNAAFVKHSITNIFFILLLFVFNKVFPYVVCTIPEVKLVYAQSSATQLTFAFLLYQEVMGAYKDT